ncbi:RAMP superfamily CRISPR-associated protein [Picosynechococcus sp. NKBG042902]|uniref:RAMP superfamily CRISPR-associated protein n=1 Tax=Picosynechococcus sp. NKBG042902 TaxID=490193 RepID=UPI0004AB7203|nr:RAMP superfamily CRISPR-associated protein [Picosynechococcus sp. NKBG042902]
MARQIHTRWKITGRLKAETPIHVGGMGGDADTDLALAVNGKGNYYIPGTSLAGAFRGWLSKPFSKKELEAIDHPVNQLWGFQDRQGNGHASFVIIDDAEIGGDPQIEIREGVGIDRDTGAAADKAKYSRAILPKGVTFPLKITLDCKKDSEATELWKLLLALENGDIRIGAAKTRGLGKVKLIEKFEIEKHQLNNADGLFKSLLNQDLEEDWSTLKANITYQSPAKLDLCINWQPKDPVMVKAEGDGIAVDILPLVSRVANNDVRFVIPGSSIKGVLRAHAERIVRTVCEKDTGDKFLKQVQLSLIDELFGAASYKRKNQEIETGLIGILGVDDCYGTLPMNPEHWAAVENAPKDHREFAGRSVQTDELTELKGRLSTALKIDETEAFKKLQPAMHVAIDRWTGGAADGMLYSVLEPIGVDWEPIGIHLDLARLEKYHFDLLQPAIALLLLVLRDFANRKIPIGYGTNRGMGTVEVIEMQSIANGVKNLDQLNGEHSIANNLSDLDPQLLEQLTEAWRDWIKSSTQTNQKEEQAA